MIDCYGKGIHRRFVYKRKPTNQIYSGSFDLIQHKDRYVIWSLSVDPRYRRRGHATRMLTEFIEQFAFDKPLFLYVYKTNEIAIRLYEKVGFVIVGEYGWSGDAWVMQYKGKEV